MPALTHAPSMRAVDAAIMQVLGAEQRARTEVRQCIGDAEQIRQAARDQAHRIAERAARRVALVHRCVDAALQSRIDELQRQRRALQESPAAGADQSGRVCDALDRLATELGDGTA